MERGFGWAKNGFKTGSSIFQLIILSSVLLDSFYRLYFIFRYDIVLGDDELLSSIQRQGSADGSSRSSGYHEVFQKHSENSCPIQETYPGE